MSLSTLLPIGAFSNATQLSAKALRLYAAQGILPPARIDAETGYRFYRPEQVRDARLVRLLRELDMPLTDIAALIANPARTESSLKQQVDMLARRHARQQAAYQAALDLLHCTPTPANMPIILRSLDAVTTVTLRYEANAWDLFPRARARLADFRRHLGRHAPDDTCAFIPLDAPLSGSDVANVELCVHTAGEIPAQLDASCTSRCWSAVNAACIEVVVEDELPDLTGASDALFDWFDRNGHSLRETPRIYFFDDKTELAWPVS